MKLTDKIHILKIDFEIAISPDKKLPRFVNCILIFGDKITLIDTGVAGSEELIFEYINKYNRKSSDIGTVILSHSHPDHIGSAAIIKEITGCCLLANEFEKEWIENIDTQNRERPVPGFYSLVKHSVKLDGYLTDRQIFRANTDVTLEFIHAPGHSKGSMNILFKENNILFTADSIPLKGDIPNYDSFPELIKSVRKIKENTEYGILLTSWTPPVLDLIESYQLIREGEQYMKQIDALVKENYKTADSEPFSNCRATIKQLGLPSFLANPITDKAFRSHLKNMESNKF